MTDEERALLYRVAEQSDRMHKAFMEPPATGGQPLIHDIGKMSQAFNRGQWGLKAFLYGLPTLAACGAAIQWIVRLVKTGGVP
ncbi:MAG: hypothetical protein AAFY43_01735 [Pseudomonadota bacterium]